MTDLKTRHKKVEITGQIDIFSFNFYIFPIFGKRVPIADNFEKVYFL